MTLKDIDTDDPDSLPGGGHEKSAPETLRNAVRMSRLLMVLQSAVLIASVIVIWRGMEIVERLSLQTPTSGTVDTVRLCIRAIF